MNAPGQAPVRIGLVDYGMGNRRSAEKAFEHVGARVHASSDPEVLRTMDGLVLPGVGAFPAGMSAIRALGLEELLIDRARAGVPLLGLCLGMQLLFERSEEHDGADGLGLLAGEVRRLNAPGLKLPHIGWSEVRWRCATPLAEGLPDPATSTTSTASRPTPQTRTPCSRPPTTAGSSRRSSDRGTSTAHNRTRRSPPHTVCALLANFTRLCGRAVVPA